MDNYKEETVIKLHDSSVSNFPKAAAEENQINNNSNIDMEQVDRKTQTPSAMGST